MEMGNVSKRQQPDHRAENSQKPPIRSSTQRGKHCNGRQASAGPITDLQAYDCTDDRW